MGVAIFVVVLVLVLAAMRSARQLRNWRLVLRRLAEVILELALGFGFFMFLRWFNPKVSQFFSNTLKIINDKLGIQNTQIIIGVAAIVVGVLAYQFKRRNQKWYGVVEVAVGALSALAVAANISPGKLELAKWSTLAGSAYVIARGLSNYVDANQKKTAVTSSQAL